MRRAWPSGLGNWPLSIRSSTHQPSELVAVSETVRTSPGTFVVTMAPRVCEVNSLASERWSTESPLLWALLMSHVCQVSVSERDGLGTRHVYVTYAVCRG